MKNIQGDVARAWLYMSDTYGIRLSRQERAMFEAWHEADPVSAFELLRDQRIEAIQGEQECLGEAVMQGKGGRQSVERRTKR